MDPILDAYSNPSGSVHGFRRTLAFRHARKSVDKTAPNLILPNECSEYEYLVPEVNNARVWAGVHFRNDMLAGNMIGEQVANTVMEKVDLDGPPGERSKRVLGQPLVTSVFFGEGGPEYH